MSNDSAGDSSKGIPAALKGGPVWFVTFATYHRRLILESAELSQVCDDALRETCTRNEYRVYALAIMPDHIHIILDGGKHHHQAPKIVNNLKGVASRRVFQAAPELKMDIRSAHLWADEYQALLVKTHDAFRRMCHYVEENPVKLGFQRQYYSWVLGERPERLED